MGRVVPPAPTQRSWGAFRRPQASAWRHCEGALATADHVYALMARNDLYVDLAAAPLVEPQQVLVYRDQPTAEAQALLRASRLRTWVALWRAAEATYQCGYVGLLPQTAQRGNRTQRTPQEADDVLDTCIAEHFETPTQPPARAVYRAYHRGGPQTPRGVAPPGPLSLSVRVGLYRV